jgi:hypothetical protein
VNESDSEGGEQFYDVIDADGTSGDVGAASGYPDSRFGLSHQNDDSRQTLVSAL